MGNRLPDVEELAAIAIDCGYKLHRRLGPGLFESVYRRLLAASLECSGVTVEQEKPIDIEVDGLRFKDAFRVDLLLGGRFLIEVKATERRAPVHTRQALTYLRLMDLPLGLVMNFDGATFREGVKRVVNGHDPFANFASLREPD